MIASARLAPSPVPTSVVVATAIDIASGGESLGAETYEWGKSAFGLLINEFYGQT